jgi:hypothetical protein
MNWTMWLFSISPTALLLMVGWLFRQMIVTRLRASVKHEFDSKLAELSSQLAQRGEMVKADLRSKEAQLDALRSGALSALASRQEALEKRRLDAIDQLWAAAITLTKSKFAARLMQRVDFESAAKETERNEDARQFFKAFNVTPEKFPSKWEDAAKAQPYVTPMAWAYYSAYQAIAGLAVIQLHILAAGIASVKAMDYGSVQKLVRAALPHQAKGMDDHGPQFAFYLLDELEEALLKELRLSLVDSSGSKEGVQQAAKVLKEAENVQFSVAEQSDLQR